jgi:hypothetical protein
LRSDESRNGRTVAEGTLAESAAEAARFLSPVTERERAPGLGRRINRSISITPFIQAAGCAARNTASLDLE